MDQDIKKLLEENLKLSKENNELLRKVRDVQRWGQIVRVLYWLLIIGVAFGAFYYIKPYLGNLLNLYSGGVSNINNVTDITKSFKGSQSDIQELLKELNK